MSYLPITQGAKENLEKRMMTFYWQRVSKDRKLALISWEKICRPREAGDINLKLLSWLSKALGAKLVWKIYIEHNRKWVKILQKKYLSGSDPSIIFRTTNPPKGSRVWNFILDYKNLIIDHITWDVVDGNKALF